MELKELLLGLTSSSLGSQLTPATAEDFMAIWQIPLAQMRRLQPLQMEAGSSLDSWSARSHCLCWRVPGAVQVSQFRQILTCLVQQQPWMRAQWLPLTATNSDWALMLPKQHYLDFEYVDISDMPLVDDESWWSDYGQLLLSLIETPMVHRLLKLDDGQYLYLCCFWPDYLAPQAMFDWLSLLAKAWQSPDVPAMFDRFEVDQSALKTSVAMLEQRLLSVTLPTITTASMDLQQQLQVMAPAAQQALLLLRERYGCQLIDVLALLTALLVDEYYAPQQSQSVVCYPADQSGLITACRPFFIRYFASAFSVDQQLAEILSAEHLLATITASGWAWADVGSVEATEVRKSDITDLPVFAVSHLYAHDVKGYEAFRYRPSQIQGVQLWLVEMVGAWQWQLFYDTQRFMPLQWLSRLEQLLVQIQCQDSLQALKFITDAEQRLYQRTPVSHSKSSNLPMFNGRDQSLSQDKANDAQVLDWLYHHARLSPESLAIYSDGQQLSYRQLWQRGIQWSAQLKAEGAGSERVVALHFALGVDLFVAILAVWLSGAAVVVLDPRWPLARKRFLIKQTAAHLIIGEPFSATDDDVLPLQNMSADILMAPLVRPLPLDGDALACVLMTIEHGDTVSGVEFSHQQIAQQIYSSCQALGWLAQSNWCLLLNAELCSEALIRQMAMVLSQGGTLVIPPQLLEDLGAWHAIGHSLSTANVPAIDYVEIRVAQLADILLWLQTQPPVLARCRQLVLLETPLVGQSLTSTLQLSRVLPSQTAIWVGYCCPESLGFLALFDYRQRLSARYAACWPVGKLLADIEYRVVNAQGRLCPWGLSGDLYLRGDALTQTYLPPRRTSSWLPLSTGLVGDETGLWLRTGDRVQHDHKGQLFWLGREDDQCYVASMRMWPHSLAAAFRTLGRVQSLTFIQCVPLASIDPAAATWVVWQPCVQATTERAVETEPTASTEHRFFTEDSFSTEQYFSSEYGSSVIEWQQVLSLLKGFVPESLLPQYALVVKEDAQKVAERLRPWLAQAPQEQLLSLQHFFQQDSQQQLRTLAFWQQRFSSVAPSSIASASMVKPAGLDATASASNPPLMPINPAAYATLDANFLSVDDDLANLSMPSWLAALRLAWQVSAEVPALLWVETFGDNFRGDNNTQIINNTQGDNSGAVSYCEQLTAYADTVTDRRALEWVEIAKQDWLQGLDHQPACLPLLSNSMLSPSTVWPLSQKLALILWRIESVSTGQSLDAGKSIDVGDGFCAEKINDLVLWQKRLTQRLQRLARTFGWAAGRLQYRHRTWLQVVHADAAPSFLHDLAGTWLQQLAYLRDFPLLPLAGLQCLSPANTTVRQSESKQQEMQYPLTLPQQELLMLLRASEQTAHVSLGYWLDHSGALNLQRWQQIVQQWVNAFAALRTRFVVTTEVVAHQHTAHQHTVQQPTVRQQIMRHQEVILLSEDWSEQRQDWQSIAIATQALIDRPRPLFKSELIDYYVIQLSSDLWRLLIIAHPLVIDDRASSRILLQMYQQYVTAIVPSLLDVYPAFLHQQQQLSLPDTQAEDRRHWLERGARKKRRGSATHHVTLPRPQKLVRWQFAGVLPIDQSGYRCQSFTINETVWLPLLQRARREGVPVAFVIKVFYSMLLAQYADGQQDSLLFEYEAGRSGLFVDSLGCFCRRRALWLPNGLLQSKTATIEQLLQHCKLEYDQTRRFPLEEIDSPGLTAQMGFVDVQIGFIDKASEHGIMLGFSESLQQPGCVSLLAHAQAQRLTLRLHYYAQEFNPLDFLLRLVSLLEQWLAGVSRLADLDFLLPEERHQQMQLWSQGNRRIAKWPPIYRLIDEQVTRTPDALAVQCGSQTLTYQQMENLAAQTAQRLLQLGCQPGEAVMVCTYAQLYLPAAILGVLKTAACYLPVDASKTDLRDRLRHCRVRFLLTQAACKQEYENHYPELTVLSIDQFDANRVRSFQPRPVAAKDPLYVLYRQTDSQPLLISYEAEANLVQWYCSELAIKPQDRLLLYSTADFYASQKNIFAALVSGACLVMSSQRAYDPEQLLQEIDEQQISLLNITPGAFYPLLTASSAQPWQALASLRVVVFGKGAVEVSRLRSWLGRPDNRCRVLIAYSQDVCADVVAGHWLDVQQDQEFVPIGKPVHGVQMFVMDALGRLKPTGLTGQIVILGQTVGRAVDESMIEPSLVDVPGVGRLFYSCDLACYARPGQLRYIGKVQSSGSPAKQPSAPLEKHTSERNKAIENKLRGFDGVVNAKLVQLDHEWVVYLQLADQQTFSIDTWRNKVQGLFLEKNLPLRFVSVDQLPTDAEGDAA